jgi:hypothetical protein
MAPAPLGDIRSQLKYLIMDRVQANKLNNRIGKLACCKEDNIDNRGEVQETPHLSCHWRPQMAT